MAAVPRSPLSFALAGLLLATSGALGPAAAGGDDHPAAPPGGPERLTVEGIWRAPSRLKPVPAVGPWRPGRDAWVEWRTDPATKSAALWQVEAATGAAKRLVAPSEFDAEKPAGSNAGEVAMRGIGRAGPAGLLWSQDGDGLFLSLRGDVFHADLATGARRRLTRTTSPLADLRVAPDGRKLSFTRDHDLFAVVMGAEGAREVRLTTGGSEDVLHGELDWVYPEELDCATAAWWSPDSARVAFLRLDETKVPRVPIVDPAPLHGSVRWQRYPKAGDPNPVPGVGVVGLDGAPPVWLDLGADPDVYVPWVAWWPDGSKVAVAILDRSQTRFEIRLFDPAGGAGKTFWREEDARWVDVPPSPRFLAKTPAMLLHSRRDGFWRHWLAPLDGTAPTAVTPGKREAGRLLAVDEDAGVCFVETATDDRRRTVVARVPLAGGAPTVLTDPAWTHAVTFSPTARLFVDTASRATDPPRAAVRGADGTILRALGNASTPEWEALARVAPQFVAVEGADGVALDAVVWKPRDFDASRRWAVLVDVYGGPGSRTVRDAFSEKGTLWRALLAQEGILSFSIDGRGTGGRGKEFEACVHRRLGLLETEDQVRGAAWLRAQPWVDAQRLAITGWSYGGFMVAHAMTKAPDAFRAGIAGAAVTDWRLYDTIYTERYMDRPSENVAGYDASSAVLAAASMKGSLLLLHGLLDDNVHPQNTVRLSDALIRAHRPFEQFLYPGQAHGVGGPDGASDLHARMLDFLRRNLLPPADRPKGG